jgi:hypothetical protein
MRILLAAFLFAVAAPANAGLLDLDYPAPKPDPTLTLVNGLFFPGMGWFHVSVHTEDRAKAQEAQGIGVAFAAATALSAWVMVNNAKKGDTKGMAVGLSLTMGLRWLDLWGSVARAHTTRYENRMGSEESRPSRRAEPERTEPRRSFFDRREPREERETGAGYKTEPERFEPESRPRRSEPERTEPETPRKSKSVLPVWLE